MIMIIIYISQRAWRPSNRQIINYDAGIVLIDLHQLNVKTTEPIQISDTEYRATSCQRTEPAEQQPATSAFPSQMIEQINIALEQKGQEFLSLGH